MKSYKDHSRNLRIISASAHRGQSYALNVGVRASAAKSVAFCDADNGVTPGMAAEMGEASSQYDSLYAVESDHWLYKKYRSLGITKGMILPLSPRQGYQSV